MDEGEAPTPASESMRVERSSASFCPSKSYDNCVSAQLALEGGSASAPKGLRRTTDDLAVYDVSDLVEKLFRHVCVVRRGAGEGGNGHARASRLCDAAMSPSWYGGVYGVQMCCEASMG